MILPDFNIDPDFARLRQSIGATSIVRLPPPEWRELNGPGIDIENITRVEANRDDTLSYSGRRVLVYIREQTQQDPEAAESKYRYHIAECRTIQKMRDQGWFKRYVLTTRKDGLFLVSLRQAWSGQSVDSIISLKVCKDCLTKLDWKGYRTHPHLVTSRKFWRRGWNREKEIEIRKWKEEIWNGFAPRAFLKKYGNRVRQLPDQAADTAQSSYNLSRTRETQVSSRTRQTQVSAKADAFARASILNRFCYDCGLILEDLGARRWLKVYRASEAAQLKNLCLDCFSQKPGKEDIQQTEAFKEFQRWCGLGENGGAEGDD